MKKIFLLFGFLLMPASLLAQDFFLAENGVTVISTDAAVGDTGTVNGATYTKGDRDGLNALNDTDQNNPEFATTSTSGIEHLSNPFQSQTTIDLIDLGNEDNIQRCGASSLSTGGSGWTGDGYVDCNNCSNDAGFIVQADKDFGTIRFR